MHEDVGAEEKPVVDVERLHRVTLVGIIEEALEEEHEFGLVERDVAYILHVVDLFSGDFCQEVLLALVCQRWIYLGYFG